MAAKLGCWMCGQKQWSTRMHIKSSFLKLHRCLSYFRKKVFVSRNHFCTYKTNRDGKATVDEDEVAKFGQLGSQWWDPNGEMAPLHTMNKLRVPFVKKALLHEKHPKNPAKPLQGLRILDVGCGGGILSEPLARLGADVTGIDASPRTIHVALWHSRQFPEIANHMTFHCTTVEDVAKKLIAEDEQFDCVVASEILEHVSDKPTFVSASSDLVKPGGHMIITTINRTPQSYAAAILGAEYIFRLLPLGTHDWHKFVTVDELREMLLGHLEFHSVHGMAWNPFSNTWRWSQNTCINFLLHAKKALAKNSAYSENDSTTSDKQARKENGSS